MSNVCSKIELCVDYGTFPKFQPILDATTAVPARRIKERNITKVWIIERIASLEAKTFVSLPIMEAVTVTLHSMLVYPVELQLPVPFQSSLYGFGDAGAPKGKHLQIRHRMLNSSRPSY